MAKLGETIHRDVDLAVRDAAGLVEREGEQPAHQATETGQHDNIARAGDLMCLHARTPSRLGSESGGRSSTAAKAWASRPSAA